MSLISKAFPHLRHVFPRSSATGLPAGPLTSLFEDPFFSRDWTALDQRARPAINLIGKFNVARRSFLILITRVMDMQRMKRTLLSRPRSLAFQGTNWI